MVKLRRLLLFILDILLFWGALVLALFFRYGHDFQVSLFRHLPLFFIIFILWMAIFELVDLYQLKIFKGKSVLLARLLLAFTISIFVSAAFLYFLSPFLKVSPKTNFLIFALIFLLLDYLGRILLNQIFFSKQKVLVLFLGEFPSISDLILELKLIPQFGYKIIGVIPEEKINTASFSKMKVDVVVISPSFIKKQGFTKLIYSFLSRNIEVIDFRDFYETIFQKEPLEMLDENWFIEKMKIWPFYNFSKRFFDIVLSSTALLFTLPLILFCGFLIKIFSSGPALFKQNVVGKNNKKFTLYKLRTMKDGNGYPLWTLPEDERITKIGNFLRFTHLDELPQLYNILRGNLSFVGPRPERIELVKIFEKKLPYYNYRNVVKPGFTGWAQINYKPSASIQEASEKLGYDFYYLKNRSFLLDLLIILKTAKLLLGNPR